MVPHSVRGALGALAITACLMATGCGSSGSPTSPGPSQTPTPSTLSLAGTWTGTIGRPLGELRIKSWTATQTGTSVSGPMVLDLDGSDAELLITATFTGTVSGTQLTSIIFTVPAGSIADLKDCGFSGTGALTASASSLSGSLAMTFPTACVGEKLVSTTPTASFPFTMAK